MSIKWCCVTWKDGLADELYALKDTEINVLITKNSLPRSIFASVLRCLAEMKNFCPVCGQNLVTRQPVLNSQITDKPARPVKVEFKESICVKRPDGGGCEGKGYINDPDVKCMLCLGTGKISYKNISKDGGAMTEITKLNERKTE